MAKQTKIEVDGLGEIFVHRKKGAKNIRIRVDNNGLIHLTLPWWVSKSAGLAFVQKQNLWLQEQSSKLTCPIRDGMQLGNSIKLSIRREDRSRIGSTLTNDTLNISLPRGVEIDDPSVKKHIIAGLKQKCEQQIEPRLSYLAKKHGYKYRTVKFRVLKSRWGSCNQDAEITINVYLVQLPLHIIDYVLLHELNHTKHMHHGREFWDAMARILPDVKTAKKELKQYHPNFIDISR